MDSSRQQSSSQSRSPNDDYFNDLAQQPPAPNEQQPKSKRMACVLCRKRKLKCDGAKPACATCVRLSHDCAYDEVRKKSGPKRGYVKALEARLGKHKPLRDELDSLDHKAPEARTADRFVQRRSKRCLRRKILSMATKVPILYRM